MGGRRQHWLENIPDLARRGRVVVLDPPGFGSSQPPRPGYSLDGSPMPLRRCAANWS